MRLLLSQSFEVEDVGDGSDLELETEENEKASSTKKPLDQPIEFGYDRYGYQSTSRLSFRSRGWLEYFGKNA